MHRSCSCASNGRSISSDSNRRDSVLVYPTVWLLDADVQPLMQMPAGAGTFQTVPEQLEILRWVR